MSTFNEAWFVANELGASTVWLNREARAGRLPHIKQGKRILFNSEQVREILLERSKENQNGD